MALWREVAGYEGLYAVSDEGEVVSLPRVLSNGRGTFKTTGKALKQGTRAGKYKFVHLSKGNVQRCVSVHRLVAMAFLGNPENLPEVNHKDENPSNNRVENLEWCSRQYNIDYSKSKKYPNTRWTAKKWLSTKAFLTPLTLQGFQDEQ